MKFSELSKGYAALNGGDWVGDIPFPLFGGIRLKVRRLWNPEFAARNEELIAAAVAKGEEPDERAIMNDCLVTCCLDGWQGIDEPYTPEIGAKALLDPEAGGIFRSAILWAAAHLVDKIKADIEADEKN